MNRQRDMNENMSHVQGAQGQGGVPMSHVQTSLAVGKNVNVWRNIRNWNLEYPLKRYLILPVSGSRVMIL